MLNTEHTNIVILIKSNNYMSVISGEVYCTPNTGTQKYSPNIIIYRTTDDSPRSDFKLAVVLQVAL